MTQTGDYKSMSTGWSYDVGTIPKGFRPIHLVQYFYTVPRDIQIRISPTGSITFYNYGTAVTSDTNGGCTLCWITNDP